MNLPSNTLNESTLQAFSAAWNQHDIDAIMTFMSDDCVFQTPAGSETFGTRHVGQQAVRQAFTAIFEAMPDANWSQGSYLVQGDLGLSQWRFTGTDADGRRVDVDGVNVFTLKDGKIKVKNAFRKDRTLLATP